MVELSSESECSGDLIEIDSDDGFNISPVFLRSLNQQKHNNPFNVWKSQGPVGKKLQKNQEFQVYRSKEEIEEDIVWIPGVTEEPDYDSDIGNAKERLENSPKMEGRRIYIYIYIYIYNVEESKENLEEQGNRVQIINKHPKSENSLRRGFHSEGSDHEILKPSFTMCENPQWENQMLNVLAALQLDDPKFSREIQPHTLNKKDIKLEEDQKLFIFDMDETLLHTRKGAELQEGMGSNTRVTDKGTMFDIRPYLKDLIGSLSKVANVVIYSAAESQYVHEVLHDIIDLIPRVNFYYTRKHCTLNSGIYLKTSKITNFHKKNIVIIDDNIGNWPKDLDNIIPILPFFGDPGDEELRKLKYYLLSLVLLPDVRVSLRESLEINKKIVDMAKELDLDLDDS